MLDALAGFVSELRARGLAVSPAEAIDAARAASAVGPENRRRFRAALSAALAKDLRGQALLADAFDAFFAPPARPAREGKGTGKEEAGGIAGAGTGGRGAGTAAGRPPARPPARPEDPGQPDVSVRPALPDPASVPSLLPSRRAGLRALRPNEIRAELAKGRPETDRSRPAARRTIPPEASARTAKRESSGSAADRTVAVDWQGQALSRLVNGTAEEQHTARSGERIRLERILVADRAAAETRDIRRRDLRSPATSDDERRLAAEAVRIVEEIRLGRARRMRRAPRGRLFMKRLIRENLATGGVPFTIPRQSPRAKRPHLVLLVDVSWSVARAAGLFVLMVHGFVRSFRHVSVFFFVDRPVDATDLARRWLDGHARSRRGTWTARSGDRPDASRAPRAPSDRAGSGSAGTARGDARAHDGNRHEAGRETPAAAGWSPYGEAGLRSSRPVRSGPRGQAPGAGVRTPGAGRSFLDAVRGLPGLDLQAASDYGRAFYALASGPLRARRGDTVLVVLGDGRTNVFEPLPWAFEEIAGRARRVLWLVPEPRERWGTGDSALPAYLPSCDLAIEATDLEGLAHGVRAIVCSVGRP